MLKMTISRKIFKNSFIKKFVCILAKFFVFKGINAFFLNIFLEKVSNVNCKDKLFVSWTSLSVTFPTVEKLTLMSKALRHFKSLWLLASQIIYFESNVIFTWNRA